MIFAENKQLFGFDKSEGIVAVEFFPLNQVQIFLREADGSTSIESEEFAPFLWSSSAGTRLEGALALDQIIVFPDWRSYQEARARFAKEGTPFFAANDPVQQYLTRSGRTLFKGMRFEDLRRLQIDIETAISEGFEFSSPERDAVTAIALSDSTGWEEIFVVEEGSVESERTALEALTAIIQTRDPDVIEGHNLFKFDLPFLVARAKSLKVRLAWGREGSILSSRPSRLQIAEKAIQYPKFTVRGRHIVDTWVLAQYYDVASRELESFGLKGVARHFGVSENNRVFLEALEIQRAYREDSDAFRTYALQDVRETRALAAILSRSYFIQAQIFPYNYQDVIIRGNATKIDALFLREYLRRGHSIPDLPKARPFEGGYTDIFVTGVVENVWHCDVTSLYPSVMLVFGYLPKNDALGVFGGMLRELRAFRLQVKNTLRVVDDPLERGTLHALQGTFKILLNSFYGYLGFAQGHFADFDAAELVTAKGREILKHMVDWLAARGARVIEIDTDGIYFRPPNGVKVEDLQSGLAAELPEGIEVDFDKRYPAMFSYKAKNYALLDDSGALVIKGAALKSRGMEPYLRDYLEAFLRLLLRGEPEKAAALREDLTLKIRRRELSIEALAKTEALQDSVTSYLKKITASSRNRSAAFELAIKSGRNYQAGDQISYYITGASKKITAYENARLVSEWNPQARDENTEYYVAKLDELATKFEEHASKRPVQADLFAS
ncbi:MAG TPA: DNA polymerase domain-containing protein [Terrimicrobiaceae bacterium]